MSPQAAIRAGGRGAGALRAGEGHSRFTAVKALLVGQVALSLVLVVAAGLLLGTFRTLATLHPGFSEQGVLLVSTDLRNTGFSPERQKTALAELLERLRAVPGVRSASIAAITPLSGMGWNGLITVEGYTPASERDAAVWFNQVSDGYFATMRTAVLAGREFDARDQAGAPRVVVVNRALARKFFHGANPVGRQLRMQTGPRDYTTAEVVGLVDDAKYQSLREEPQPTLYLPMGQGEVPPMGVAFQLRADGPPAALAPRVAEAIAQVHPAISLEFRTLTDLLAASLTRERLLATLSGFFGALALLLVTVGLYGTTAYSVVRRRNEIGIRMALGAARGSVLRMVLGEVGRLAAAGVALGALAALAATRLVASFLFGVSPTDPATLALSVAALAAVALAAGAVPAWRAARIDPMVALREE